MRTVGQREKRPDAIDKLTGSTLYPQDIYRDNLCHGATLRSSIPCGSFVLNTDEALSMPGVLGIFTAKDIPGHNHHGVLFKDHEVFCQSEVRRIGDPLAFVVAQTQQQAEAARDAIKVIYEAREGVFDPEKALEPNAPKVHQDRENLIYHYKCRRGDLEAGFASAKAIVEAVYETPFVDHAFLQLEAGVAHIAEDGRLVIQAATQYPHFDQLEIAEALGLETDQVIVDNPAVGGAFGGREDLTLQVHIGLAALRLQRPVKVVYSREESFYAHSKRHPIRIYMKTGADAEGRLTALEARLYGDSGAYASWAINVLRKAGVHVTGPYRIPNVKVDSYAVYTNNPFAGAMRGFGATQVAVAYEQQMDRLAEALGMSPYTIRQINLFMPRDMTANGQVLIQSVPLARCLDTIWDAMNEEAAK